MFGVSRMHACRKSQPCGVLLGILREVTRYTCTLGVGGAVSILHLRHPHAAFVLLRLTFQSYKSMPDSLVVWSIHICG